MSGYFAPEGKPVTWRGLTSVYAPAERAIMRELPVREQAVIHLLKASTHGEIRDSGPPTPGPPTTANGSGLGLSSLKQPATYIDPEDIPFGPPAPRKRPIYALVWTWRQNRTIEPDPKRPGKKRPLTKGRATRSMRAWKKWYERQGWKVTSHGAGYWANGPQSERHAIGIHEYDPVTKERLK